MDAHSSITMFWISFIICILFLLAGFAPAWRKRLKTIPLSNEQILALFPDKTSFPLETIAKEIEKTCLSTVSFSELAERLELLVQEGKLTKRKSPNATGSLSIYHTQHEEDGSASCDMLYERVI